MRSSPRNGCSGNGAGTPDWALAWNEDAAQFQQAQAVLLDRASALTARRFEQTTWIKETWSQYVAVQFNGEEANVIATHFQTEGGQLQRKLLDWYLGEMVMFNYAFTDRLDYNLRGSEPELLALQKAAQQRIPVEDLSSSASIPTPSISSPAAPG